MQAVLLTMVLLLLGGRAQANMSLLVEEPFGNFGEMNPTGHAAILFDHICAETPTRLRPCEAGETGTVVSRYHHVAGYDWLAMPVLPYFYAVEDAGEVPAFATPAIETELRERYRQQHLEALAPDLVDGRAPGGEWIQLVGASYDRTIHGFTVYTSAEQDRRLMALLNDRRNVSHFNLFFNNCADLSRAVINHTYPHAGRKSYLADFGFTTPKHLAKTLTQYAKKHPETALTTFVIPQVPGSVERSTPVLGVAESLVKSKKYVLPLAVMYPEFTSGLAVAYLMRGRYTMPTGEITLTAESFAAAPGNGGDAADGSVGVLEPTLPAFPSLTGVSVDLADSGELPASSAAERDLDW